MMDLYLLITKEKYILFTKHIQDITEKESRNFVKLRFINLIQVSKYKSR